MVTQPVSTINLIPIAKSKKLPNPLMFDRNWNNLYPFIIKLSLKLLMNHDRYSSKASKVSYGMSYLSKDTV